MLILSRKKNESIVISDNITLKVLEIRGDRVALGFEADRSIPILREEIIRKDTDEKEAES